MAIERILVTGGAGFLGSAILRELAKDAVIPRASLKEVRVYDLRSAEVVGEQDNAVSIEGDVRDYARLLEACRGIDVVLHVASLIDWGDATREELEGVNVSGVENVIRACQEAGVPALVYTSSMDVVCGKQPVVDADETTPYPAVFTNDYSRTKGEAEKILLAANGSPRKPRPGEDASDCRLATCALRPCGIFGEADPYHVGNVLRIVREGSLPFRLGDGTAVFQHVYVGNVAHAHLLAAKKLTDPDRIPGGEAYFITDDSPALEFLEFMEEIIEPLGYELPPRDRRMPYWLMFSIGALLEGISVVVRPFVRFRPTLTRSSVRFVCHTHSFVGDKARRDLGYLPAYSHQESIARTVEYFRNA